MSQQSLGSAGAEDPSNSAQFGNRSPGLVHFFPQEYGSDGKENEIKEQEHGVDITTRMFLLWRYSPLRRVVRLPYTGAQELAFYWVGGHRPG